MSYINRNNASKKSCEVCFDKTYTTATKGDLSISVRCERCRIHCDVCLGDGVTFHKRGDGYQYVVDCPQCTNLEKRMKRFNEAKIPARYHTKDFGNFNVYADEEMSTKVRSLDATRTSLHNYAMSFVPGDPGVLIGGRVGTGKTHLLVAFIRYLTLEKGIQSRFIEFTHLLSDLREAYETRKNATDILNNLSCVPVLFIDVLGKGRNNDWELSVIDELISKRYNSCLPTFFTTNYPLTRPKKPRRGLEPSVDTQSADFGRSLLKETLTDRVGQRIVSRITEMCDVVVMARDVPDFRERQRQRRQEGQDRPGLEKRRTLTRPH